MKTCGCLRLVLFRQVHHHDTFGDTDLDRRKPDAGSVVHGLEHVVCERPNAGVNALDRLGNEPEPLVRNFQDVPQRHSGDLSGA